MLSIFPVPTHHFGCSVTTQKAVKRPSQRDMTSFRSSRPPSTKEESPQWYRRGLLSGRRSSKLRSPAESCVSGSSGNSFVGLPPTRQRQFGLRRLASDSHLGDQFTNNSAHSPSSHTRSVAPSIISTVRAPSIASDSQSQHRPNTMAGMLDMDRGRSRRDRTFVGSRCAVCEEPLEHTLRGERILQFSCSHVAHEACFYEYIKEVDFQYCPECNAPLGLDSSRGGNVLDIGLSLDPRPCDGRYFILTFCRKTQ